MEPIRSAQNPLIQRVRAVLAGREPALVLLEGDQLVDEALGRGVFPELVLVSDARAERLEQLSRAGAEPRAVHAPLMERLGSQASSQGILALLSPPELASFEDFECGPRSLLLVVGGIQDPGNLGGLARSAEAAGAQAIAIDRAGCSPWNPKALRGSMGSLLRLPVISFHDPQDVADELAARGWRQVLAKTRGASAHTGFDWAGGLALWVTDEKGRIAGESPGLRALFEETSIAMAPGVESLNVTVAASILLFAAGRTGEQRP